MRVLPLPLVLLVSLALLVLVRPQPSKDATFHEEDWLTVIGTDSFSPGLTDKEIALLASQGVSPADLALERRDESLSIKIKGFHIARREVSAEEYAEFLASDAAREAGIPSPPGWKGKHPPAGTEKLPIRGITLEEAQAYAAFRRARLPSEVEWEFAFRGATQWFYPWGNAFDGHRAVTSVGQPRPVDAKPYEVHGVFHVSGNVAEWTTSRLAPYGETPRPDAPVVVRGGSFRDRASACRLTSRRGVSRDARADDVGIRLVRDQ